MVSAASGAACVLSRSRLQSARCSLQDWIGRTRTRLKQSPVARVKFFLATGPCSGPRSPRRCGWRAGECDVQSMSVLPRLLTLVSPACGHWRAVWAVFALLPVLAMRRLGAIATRVFPALGSVLPGSRGTRRCKRVATEIRDRTVQPAAYASRSGRWRSPLDCDPRLGSFWSPATTGQGASAARSNRPAMQTLIAPISTTSSPVGVPAGFSWSGAGHGSMGGSLRSWSVDLCEGAGEASTSRGGPRLSQLLRGSPRLVATPASFVALLFARDRRVGRPRADGIRAALIGSFERDGGIAHVRRRAHLARYLWCSGYSCDLRAPDLADCRLSAVRTLAGVLSTLCSFCQRPPVVNDPSSESRDALPWRVPHVEARTVVPPAQLAVRLVTRFFRAHQRITRPGPWSSCLRRPRGFCGCADLRGPCRSTMGASATPSGQGSSRTQAFQGDGSRWPTRAREERRCQSG